MRVGSGRRPAVGVPGPGFGGRQCRRRRPGAGNRGNRRGRPGLSPPAPVPGSAGGGRAGSRERQPGPGGVSEYPEGKRQALNCLTARRLCRLQAVRRAKPGVPGQLAGLSLAIPGGGRGAWYRWPTMPAPALPNCYKIWATGGVNRGVNRGRRLWRPAAAAAGSCPKLRILGKGAPG